MALFETSPRAGEAFILASGLKGFVPVRADIGLMLAAKPDFGFIEFEVLLAQGGGWLRPC
jgi:hypothetical protein